MLKRQREMTHTQTGSRLFDAMDTTPSPANTTESIPLKQDWWERTRLCRPGDRLLFADRDAARLASELHTPLFLYDAQRIHSNLRRLADTLATLSSPVRIFYAMKANRHGEILALLQQLKLCGIDACSPAEVQLALDSGFRECDVSYTGTSVSNSDIAFLQNHVDVAVNCDSLSTIRRLGEACPGREIGLRIDPAVGIGYRQNALLRYSGSRPSKFGIDLPRLDEAVALCNRHQLRISGVHFHCGCGYLTPQLPILEEILRAATAFLERLHDLRYVNIGGGQGIPLLPDDAPLDLAAWASILDGYLGNRGCEIRIEPGDYVVKDAGILVLEVNTVEQKGGVLFAGVNGGFNLHPEPAFYGLPLHAVPCLLRPGPLRKTTVAGNINEALDILAADTPLPPLCEGDFLAFLNAGGYGSAMSSNHCCRGLFREVLLNSEIVTGTA